MSRKIILIFLIFSCSILSCNKKNPCDNLINGIYQFPDLPESHNMTNQEITEFWDLPPYIATCINTEGLIETCMNYPELRLIMAGSNIQSGYDLLIKERFRGVRELESRPDRGTCLLRKYQTIDPLGYDPNWEPLEKGMYSFNIYNLHIIFSQYANLETLTNDEKIELIESAIVIHDKTKDDLDNYSFFSLECTTTLMGRLMFLNNYEEMVDMYNNNNLTWQLLNFYGPSDQETVEFIYKLSKEYLNYIKSK